MSVYRQTHRVCPDVASRQCRRKWPVNAKDEEIVPEARIYATECSYRAGATAGRIKPREPLAREYNASCLNLTRNAAHASLANTQA